MGGWVGGAMQMIVHLGGWLFTSANVERLPAAALFFIHPSETCILNILSLQCCKQICAHCKQPLSPVLPSVTLSLTLPPFACNHSLLCSPSSISLTAQQRTPKHWHRRNVTSHHSFSLLWHFNFSNFYHKITSYLAIRRYIAIKVI